MTEGRDRPPWRHRPTTLWLAAAILVVAAAALAWWVGSSAQSPDQVGARASEPTASWVASPVEHEALSATLIRRGDVRSEVTVNVGVPSSVEGDGVVTRVVVGPGESVVEGDRVLEVSGRPVFAMLGEVPAYRSLLPGMSGTDVAQLQAALVRLGYDPDTDGVFGESTKTAITAFYDDAGYRAVPVSPTAGADVAAAEQALLEAEDRVRDVQAAAFASGSAVAQAEIAKDQAARAVMDATATRIENLGLSEAEFDAAVRNRDRLADDPTTPAVELEAAELRVHQTRVELEQTRRSTADAVATAHEALRAATATYDGLAAAAAGGASTELRTAISARSRAQTALHNLQASTGPSVPQGEIVFLPAMPAHVLAAVSTVGPMNPTEDPTADGHAPGSLVTLTAGRLVVNTTIRVDDVGLVRAGMPVELLDESTATAYPARISVLASEPVTGLGGQLGHPATITPDEPLPDRLAGVNLRVTLTAASTDTAVLVVPLAAVSTRADGTSRVTVVIGANDPDPVDVAVVPGISADGFVAVEPVDVGALIEGDLVVIGT